MTSFTLLFLAALGLGTLFQLWLTTRQAAHIQGHRDSVPRAFADRISPAQHARAADYSLARLRLERAELVLGALVLLGWTLGGGLNVLDQALSGTGWSALLQGVVLIVGVVLVGSILDLPISLWSTFGIEARFGFNRMTGVQFARDKLLEWVITLTLGIPLVSILLWLMAGAGETWWLWAWLVWMTFSLSVTWAYPTVIAPLFNRFHALENGDLRARLENLLQRCGFRSSGMFVMDGSRRSSHGNAYFTGFGENKRIVFFDTLLEGLAPEEVEAVLAHELGHFKKRHILKTLLTSALFSLVGLALLGWLSQQAWFYQGLGVERASPALALTLFVLVLPVFTVFFSPLLAAFSRRHEFEADDFAAQQTDARHLISGLVKLYRDNASTLTPDPLYSAFHHSHPPAPVRVAHLSAKLGTNPS